MAGRVHLADVGRAVLAVQQDFTLACQYLPADQAKEFRALWDEFEARTTPEAKFAHYLMMVAAMGEAAVTAPGRQYGQYENSIGTGQVHIWFDQPEHGWTGVGA